MARDERRDFRGRDRGSAGRSRSSGTFDGVKNTLRSHFSSLPAEVAEIFTAQAVDATLVPEVLAAKIWKAVPDDFQVNLPFLGKYDKSRIIKFGGTTVVLFFTSLLTDVVERNDEFKKAFLKAFAFVDFSGGLMRTVATATEGSFEGVLEGLGHAIVRELIKIADMEPALREAALATALATWDEWRAIARARLGRLTGDTSTAAPTAPTSPPTSPSTTTSTTPAVAGRTSTNMSFSRYLDGELASTDSKREARAQLIKPRWETFQVEHPAEAAELASPRLAPHINQEEVAANLLYSDDSARLPSVRDPRTGVETTPLMFAVATILMTAEAAYLKANPPPAPTTPTVTGPEPTLLEQAKKKAEETLGFSLDVVRQTGVEVRDAQAARFDATKQEMEQAAAHPSSAKLALASVLAGLFAALVWLRNLLWHSNPNPPTNPNP